MGIGALISASNILDFGKKFALGTDLKALMMRGVKSTPCSIKLSISNAINLNKTTFGFSISKKHEGLNLTFLTNISVFLFISASVAEY
ncbi:MAG: hypothetical protein V1853_03910 [bacterium]